MDDQEVERTISNVSLQRRGFILLLLLPGYNERWNQDAFTCKLPSIAEISRTDGELLGGFANAFWCLIKAGVLSNPRDTRSCEAKLLSMTSTALLTR
jgi:hypothetical protein